MNFPATERLCLGTVQLGLDYGIANRGGRPSDSECDATLARAMEHGIVRWDTARGYGDAEQRIGRFLISRPDLDRVVIVSKLPVPPADLPANRILAWVNTEIESSLRALHVPRLSAWLLHSPSSIESHGAALWDAMLHQVDRGLAASVGVSVYCPAEAKRAIELPRIGAIQTVLNLLDSRCVLQNVLKDCSARDVVVYTRSAFLQGVFSLDLTQLPPNIKGLREPLERLNSLLADHGWTAMNAALPYVFAHSDVDFAVIGVDNAEQLDTNMNLARATLPADVVEQIRNSFCDLNERLLEPRHWDV